MTVDALGLAFRDRPFAGPRPFGPADAERFFGRSEEATEVAGLWQAQRITILTGPSGAGLTSLLSASVIPLLRREDVEVLPVGRVTTGSAATVIPFVAPAGRNALAAALLSSWSSDDYSSPAEQGRTISAFLHGRSGVPLLAAIDQAESLFTASALYERHVIDLISGLAEALRDHPRLHLLLAVRDAYRSEIQSYIEQLGVGESANVRIGFLTPRAALDAVRRPLETTDREFAPAAAEYVVDELGLPPSPDGAPTGEGLIAPTLLQVCCDRIWSRVPTDVRSITVDHIRAYAGVDRSLRDFVTRVLGETAAQYRIDVNVLRTWLQRTFAGRGKVGHSVSTGAAQAANIDENALRTLENRHLLRSESGPGGIWYGLYHERLSQPLDQVPGAFTAPDYLRSAELAFAAGELDLADKHVAEAMAAAMGEDRRLRADAERLLGDIAAERGRSETAENHYLSAATLLESLQDAQAVGLLLATVGRLQLVRGLRQKAFDQLRAAADRLPTDPDVNILLAQALWSMGQRQAAVGILTGLLAANEDAPDALRTRGEFLADLGEAQRALHDLDRVRLNPRPVSRAARALALATLDDGDHANNEIAAALAEAPDNGQVLLYAARVAELGGDHVTAAEWAERALRAAMPALLRHQRDEAARLLDQIRAR